MKKILFVLPVLFLLTPTTSAATEQDQNAAIFLVEKGIITTSSDYKLDLTITRREMLKVMMNLSGKAIATTCEGKFQDLPSSDWGCKYAEAALANGYIAANTNFRPDDSVTNIEALKMVMQAKNMEIRYTQDYTGERFTDWRDAYMQSAYFEQLLGFGGDFKNNIQEADLDENTFSTRGFVFLTDSRTYDEYVQDTRFWKTFTHSDGWQLKFPENWNYKEESEQNITLFGPKSPNGLDAFLIRTTDESYESLLEEGISLSEAFTIVSNNSEEVETMSGLSGKLFTTTAMQSGQEYIFTKAIIQGENMNYIFSGDEYFTEGFYKSFQIKSNLISEFSTYIDKIMLNNGDDFVITFDNLPINNHPNNIALYSFTSLYNNDTDEQITSIDDGIRLPNTNSGTYKYIIPSVYKKYFKTGDYYIVSKIQAEFLDFNRYCASSFMGECFPTSEDKEILNQYNNIYTSISPIFSVNNE